MRLVFITDSRGNGLDEYITKSQILYNNPYIVDTIGGRTLAQAKTTIQQLEQAEAGEIFYIVFCGICDFTVLNRALWTISYPRSKKAEAITEIEEIYNMATGRVIVCTIPPADLAKHNDIEIPSPTESIEQYHLIKDIETTNEKILNINRSLGIISIQTHKHVSKQRKRDKKQHFNPKTLADGLHPDPITEQKHFEHICKTALKLVKEQVPPLLTVTVKNSVSGQGSHKPLPGTLTVTIENPVSGQGSHQSEPCASHSRDSEIPGLEIDYEQPDLKDLPSLELDKQFLLHPEDSDADPLDLLNISQTSSEEDTGNFKRCSRN